MRSIIAQVRYIFSARFSTIAGTLVYFLLMSAAPFLLWLSLFFGKVDIEGVLSHELFSSVSPVVGYLKSSAESAADGAGIVLLATTLYSSTNFFYHLRRSGEIVYGAKRGKGGIRLRLLSLLLILITAVLVAFIAAVSVVGGWVLESFMPYYAADIIYCVFLTMAAFGIALVLNIFACPYRIGADEAISGSLLTTALWLIFSAGFTVYLQFASPERLYGKIAAVIVFLVWCYLMMCCFVAGMAYNGGFAVNREYKVLF